MMEDDESDQQVGVWRGTVMAYIMVLTWFLHGQTHKEIRHHKRVIWSWFEMNDTLLSWA